MDEPESDDLQIKQKIIKARAVEDKGKFVFYGTSEAAIVIFYPDGTIAINPKYTVTEAAQAFWNEVKKIIKNG